jgi:hypothetical protein
MACSICCALTKPNAALKLFAATIMRKPPPLKCSFRKNAVVYNQFYCSFSRLKELLFTKLAAFFRITAGKKTFFGVFFGEQ